MCCVLFSVLLVVCRFWGCFCLERCYVCWFRLLRCCCCVSVLFVGCCLFVLVRCLLVVDCCVCVVVCSVLVVVCGLSCVVCWEL